MAITNAQAALLAVSIVATHSDSNLRSSTVILDFADSFKGWLDKQDEADHTEVGKP